MHTPTKQQFQVVIDNLKRILKYAKTERNLNMEQGYTADSNGSICGTVHCVGGWYAIAKQLNFKTPWQAVFFDDGANAMAVDLGFKNHYELRQWAFDNHKIWGNRNGLGMFTRIEAYNNATTLSEVVVHLEGVRDRLTM